MTATLTIEHAHIVRCNPGVFDAATEAKARDLIRAEINETFRARAAASDARVMLAKKLAADFRQVESIDAMLMRAHQAQIKSAEEAHRLRDRWAIPFAIAVAAAALLVGIDPLDAAQF